MMMLERQTTYSSSSDENQVDDLLNVRQRERLTTEAKSMTESLLQATDLLGGIPWSLVHEKHGVSLFRAEDGQHVPCNVHAVCKFACQMEDVAESMITSTTESYKKMMSMLSSDFLDGAVIQNVVEPTELTPHRYVGLKWAAFKSSSPFTKDRDFIILEYVDMIEDDQGQKIAFRIMQSVDVPDLATFEESPKFTRDIVPLMGFMYHSTKKPGELRMTYTCNFDKNGDLPAWAANSAIQSHVEKCITGILKYIETFRAKKEAIVLPQQVIPMSEQDFCRICEKNFCVLRRRYNCLKCGEVICSSCSSIRNAHVPEFGERQLRVCTACVIESRRTSRHVESPPTSSSRGYGVVDGAPASWTESLAAQKRRSFDDLLEPVRTRLVEYKTFSEMAEAVTIPKANFPVRSFSDGLIMRKGSLFTSKRRGSPADLAISLEAFRQHQIRMGNAEQQPEDGDSTDDDSMECLRPSPQSKSSSKQPEELTLLNAKRPVIEVSALTRKFDDFNEQRPASPTGVDLEVKVKLNIAIERSQDIIESTHYTNELAQHVRKISHHRIIALQQEHEALVGSSNNNNSSSGSNSPSRRERHAVCHQANTGVILHEKDSGNIDQQVMVLTRAMERTEASVQYVDASTCRLNSPQRVARSRRA